MKILLGGIVCVTMLDEIRLWQTHTSMQIVSFTGYTFNKKVMPKYYFDWLLAQFV
jgi:hypothetical protein